MKLDATLLDDELLVGRVVASVRAVSGRPLTEITLDTRLYEDLGIDRENGYVLMASLHDQFQMDWTGFDLDTYFGASRRDRQPLTISRLADALKMGRWPPEPSSSSRFTLVVGLGLIAFAPILLMSFAE